MKTISTWAFITYSMLLAPCVGGTTLKVSCWEYDRGNTKVVADPGQYGDYRDKYPGLMLAAGDTLPYG
ncbi:hypothetical protein HQ560_21835, partial [bacterium]|nr:hypothetical protein [bacterium]